MTRFCIACVAISSIIPFLLPGSDAFLATRGIGSNPSLLLLSKKKSRIFSSSTDAVAAEDDPNYVEAVPMLSSVTDPEAIRLREELLELADETKKGFRSTPSQKKRANDIVAALSKFNPTKDPAAPYYDNDESNVNATTDTSTSAVNLAGKWDLIYTDAPDITSLDTSSWNPLATVQLGRIGQECSPPFIKNVIEWKKPDWIDLPFSGSKDARILQKVCTKASASPMEPMKVNLQVAGLELVAPPAGGTGNSSLQQDIEQEGLPVGLLRNNPLQLSGPLTAPFGQFEILYLDEELRIIRTNQNYLAVNRRSKEEWF